MQFDLAEYFLSRGVLLWYPFFDI